MNPIPISETQLFLATKELGFGFLVMAVVFLYLGYFLTRISAVHAIKSRIFTESSQYWLVVFEFIAKITQLALIQIGAIAIWGVALIAEGLAKDPTLAFLFAGSCYTTIGIFSDILPPEWKGLALIIAFSGLFSFAWSTSIMMSMTAIFQEAWKNKNEKVLRDFYLRHKKTLLNGRPMPDWTSTFELVISAPYKDVWNTLIDVPNWKKWNEGVTECALDNGFQIGSWFTMTLPEGDNVRSQIVDIKEYSSFTDRSVISNNTFDVIHTVTDIGLNLTKVTYTVNATGPEAKELGLGICADFSEVLHALNKFLSKTKVA